MKILVTGAGGYLGQGVVDKLLQLGKENIEVIASTHNASSINKNAKIKVSDIFDIEDPYNYFDKPDILLHLAWQDGFNHMSEKHFDNLNKHIQFIEKFVKSDIKKISIMGSMHEIGFFEGSIDENTPCNPLSYYGITKNALRQASSLMCKKYNKIYQWIRGYYIVGNSDNGCSIFSKIIQASKAGQKLFPFTMGANQFDFLDYDLFCEYTSKIVLQEKFNGIINCCAGSPMRLAERVELFIKENNLDIKLDYGKFPDRPYDSKAVWGNNKKLLDILDLYK